MPQANIDSYLNSEHNWPMGGDRCGPRPACISQNVSSDDTVTRCFATAVTLPSGFCAGATIPFSTCDYSQAAADARAAASITVRFASMGILLLFGGARLRLQSDES